MRKILATRRSPNSSWLYLVIRDGHRFTMEVWQQSAACDEMRCCKIFPFTPRPDAEVKRPDGGYVDQREMPSEDEQKKFKQACLLMNGLSRMSVSEMLKQADNLKRYGEVR